MFFKQIFFQRSQLNRDFILYNSTSINYFEQDLKIPLYCFKSIFTSNVEVIFTKKIKINCIMIKIS
jgi:hypothetical protein